MELDIELHILNHHLRILSINKNSIKNFMYQIVKIAFTNKTNCKFFSFIETNDDYSFIVDQYGYEEFSNYIDDKDVRVSRELWMPMCICGEDLPGSMSISKIAKYIILPLADSTISIMAISTYQCDYILFQEKDYKNVIKCLSYHIPKIYDESSINNGENKCIKENYYAKLKRNKSSDISQRPITLPLIIPDNTEYCIIGLYNQETFALIIPSLLDIMFYETSSYGDDNEIFFNFTRHNSDISIVTQTKYINNFHHDVIRNVENNYWKLIRIGQNSLSLEFSGVCAQISSPLESASIDEFYISSYHTGYCFIPSDQMNTAKEHFIRRGANILPKSQNLLNIFKINTESNLIKTDGVLFNCEVNIVDDECSNSNSNSNSNNNENNSEDNDNENFICCANNDKTTQTIELN